MGENDERWRSMSPLERTLATAPPPDADSVSGTTPEFRMPEPPRTQWDDLVETVRSAPSDPRFGARATAAPAPLASNPAEPSSTAAADGADGLARLFGAFDEDPATFDFTRASAARPTATPATHPLEPTPPPGRASYAAPAPAPTVAVDVPPPSPDPVQVEPARTVPPPAVISRRPGGVPAATPASDEVPPRRSRIAEPSAASRRFSFDLMPSVEPVSGRPTVPERIGLGLAVVLPPLGVLTGVVLAIASSRRRGWVPGLVSATITVGLVMSGVLGIGAFVADGYAAEAIEQRSAQAEAVPLCTLIDSTGLAVDSPTFGWPTAGASVDASITSMNAFVSRWDAAAAVAPPSVSAEIGAIAETGRTIAASVASTRTLQDVANIAQFTALASQSTLPRFAGTYCG